MNCRRRIVFPGAYINLNPLQARVPVLADNDVVMHGNAKGRGDTDDRLGHLDVGLRRRRIAGGMVVHEHISSRIMLNARWILKR